MAIRMINRLVAPTGTPDMTLNGSGVNGTALTFGVVAVPSNLGTTGDVTILVYAPGDTNPEIMTMTSRSSLTLTVTREAEEATAYPKCAHAAGAGVWIVETAANLTAFINQLIAAATAALTLSGLSDVQISALADGDVPIWNAIASKWENGPQTGGGGTGTEGSSYLLFQEQQPQATNGGTFSSGAWRTRALNTEVSDPDGHGSVSGSQITLGAGTYELRGWANAHGVAQNKLRWYDITNSAVLFYGNSNYQPGSTPDGDGIAVIEGRFTIAGATVFELQHICASTKTADGFGTNGNFATEIYSEVELRRVGVMASGDVGGLVLLEQHDASASATLDFTSFVDNTKYDEYVFELVDVVPGTSGDSLWARMGTPTIDTGSNYGHERLTWQASGSPATGGAAPDSKMILTNALGTTAGFSVNGSLKLFAPGSAIFKTLQGTLTYVTSAPARASAVAKGTYEVSTAVTAVQFLMSSGNIASGTIRVYGVSKTLGAGSGDWVKIATSNPTGTSVDFPSIPNVYTSLKVVFQARSTAAVLNTNLLLQFNADTGSNYDWTRNLLDYAGIVAPDDGFATTSIQVAAIGGASAVAGYATEGEITIPNYVGTTFFQSLLAQSALLQTQVRNDLYEHRARGWWRSATAVNEITLTLTAGNFVAGSKFTLYGMR